MAKRTVLSVLALLLIAAVPAFAQITVSLNGNVTSDGKPLPGVTVTISSPQMQGTRTTVTAETGEYNFANIPPGTYSVEFALEGMKPIKRSVTIGLSQTGRADADMKVANVSEAITVTASAPAVLETTQVAANVPQKLLNELPAGRTITAAVSLAPGVSPGVGGFSISGAPSFDNLYLVNGVTVSENVRGQPHNLFIEDAIQETTIVSGSVSAEYGRFTGGVVNTITKSGGNEFSGSYRDGFTNPKWVSKTAWPTEADHVNTTSQIHEGTLGGYFMKDRLWFFGSGRKAKTSTQSFTQLTNIGYANAFNEKRWEGKLTGQINPRHSLVVDYLDITNTEANNNFNNQSADLESLVPSRDLPNSIKSVFYNGQFATNLLLEGSWTKKYFAFKNSGSPFTDFVHGTLIRDTVRTIRYASATFCGVCDTEQRNNKSYNAKLSYFLGSSATGTHTLATGFESFDQMRYANNFQSGSNYRVLPFNASKIVGTDVYPVLNSNSELVWTPIFDAANFGHFKTNSFYVNDKWDLSSKWSFTLGVRYDKNNAKDGNGHVVSDDSAFSPRLAAAYDIRGNGHQKVNVSFARYVGALAENIGESFASVGQPAYIEFAYRGPAVNTGTTLTDKYAALAIIQNWFFNTVGGPEAALKDPSLVVATSLPGFSTQLRGKLVSPHADEWSVGYGHQVTSNAYFRADYIHRTFKDFYGSLLNLGTGTYTDPFGNKGDLATVINDSDLKRNYRAIQFQGAWNPRHFQLGTAYTFAHNEGTTETETAGSGPVSVAVNSFYPEFLNYAQRVPYGRLTTDVRHRLRLWAGYDLPTPAFLGKFNITALHSYSSGTPYSAVGTIDPSGRNSGFRYAGAPCTGTNTCPGNPGYTLSQLSTSQNYFFSARGAFQTAALQSTDMSLNWELPVSRVALFAKGDVLNIFHRSAVVTPNTTVVTRRTSATNGLTPFNPFTQTPIECPQGAAAADCTAMGANWQKGPQFGQATGPNSYQTPRTYRFAVGVRF
ncbi:MAG TPA: carboxypeptidase regulatory-like domain-containing protein [Thermoanaerobaculia bacterium]|nr:carboxypeptidase regulatory-like domain-containing protein [Thermoanaerobaculia bacterium]